MQTYRNLYPQIYDFEALYHAYRRARLGKRDRGSVRHFEQDLEGNLIQLQNELIWGEYRTGRYHRFQVFEPKPREVASLPFRDRVVQHALTAAGIPKHDAHRGVETAGMFGAGWNLALLAGASAGLVPLVGGFGAALWYWVWSGE